MLLRIFVSIFGVVGAVFLPKGELALAGTWACSAKKFVPAFACEVPLGDLPIGDDLVIEDLYEISCNLVNGPPNPNVWLLCVGYELTEDLDGKIQRRYLAGARTVEDTATELKMTFASPRLMDIPGCEGAPPLVSVRCNLNGG